MLSSAPAYLGPAEWEYRRLPMEGDLPEGSVSELDYDTRTVKSVPSAGTSVSRRVSNTTSPPTASDEEVPPIGTLRARSVSSAASTVSKASTVSTTSSASKAPSRASFNTSSSATPTRSRMAAGGPTALKLSANPAPAPRIASKPPSVALAQTSPTAVARSLYPLPRVHSEADPHRHPSTAPPAASALSVYILSHRYRLETLESLAKEHILTRMTSENCMPML